MKKGSIAALGIVSLTLLAESAGAQCSFNSMVKAQKFTVNLVRHFVGCPSITFLSPNTSTMAGVPACTPPFPTSSYRIGQVPSGKCRVRGNQELESPCSDGSGIPCSNLEITAVCRRILNSDGVTPTNDPGFALNAVARATFDDNAYGDMTVVNFPAQFAFPQASGGTIQLASDTNALLNGLFGPGSALPGCTSLQILSMAIADPAGNIFATMGTSRR
jgi:hypothetical protein